MASGGWTKRLITEGSGSPPQRGQKITVHCTGYLTQPTQKKFWSTKDPGQQAFSFNVGLGKVIRGWDEGLISMKVGERAELTMSGDYAYKNGFDAWGIPAGAELMFDCEILSIQ